MAVKPLEDRILVKPDEPETRTASGLYLPESSKERPMTGKVVAAGPGKRLENGNLAKPSVQKGDTVVFGKYAGTEVEIKGESHMIMRESELLGILEKN
ncbi:MAG: co-chaperone GroES [Phycisphaerales bacterium JB065]